MVCCAAMYSVYDSHMFTIKHFAPIRSTTPKEIASLYAIHRGGEYYNVNDSHQSRCDFKHDVTVYMDAFDTISQRYFGKSYQGYITRSHHCKTLPGGGKCFFNHDNKSSDAMFYCGIYNKLNYKRMFDKQVVIVFTLESENGHNCHFPPSNQYDIKISYRRDADITNPFFCGSKLAARVAARGRPTVPEERENLVAGFISGCKHKWRNDYLTELNKYVRIDQWGRCLKNTPGDFWKTRQLSFEKEKLDFLERNPYKFLIAFENTVEGDYVTEKIYHAYLTRSIPIYFGDKAVFDMVPSNSSLIFANDYSPKELAALIHNIANNRTLYSQYFANWDLSVMENLHQRYCLEHFTCISCRKVWEILYKRKCAGFDKQDQLH